MKKNITKLLAASVATAAIVVPVSSVAAASAFEEGVYFAGTQEFFTLDQLENLDADKLAVLFTDNNFATEIFLYIEGIGAGSIENDDNFADNAVEPEGLIPNGSYTKADGSKLEIGVTELAVESVSAINGNQVTVTLTGVKGEVPASSVKVSDSNGAVYAVTSVVAGATEGEYLVNLGTAVDGKGVLTVEVNGTSATKAFDTTLAGVTLDIAVADNDATLIANGADNTIITIKVLKDGELNETFKGAVKFQSLKGAKFAKEEVAFDKGIATVQVNSISSATEILDTIIATISDAENADAVGIQTRINLKYSPENGNEETNAKVFLTYAESNSASNVFVKFNNKVNFDKLRADFLAGDVEFTIKSGVGTLSEKTTNSSDIYDIVKVDDNTVKLALAQSGALVDNSVVTVAVDDIRTSTGLVQQSNVQFNLVDSVAPTAVAIKTIDYRTLEVQFTEAINSDEAETVSNWVLNGTRLTATDVADLQVGRYDIDDNIVAYEGTKDNRNYATIVLTADGAAKYKAEGKKNLLQAYNITDYAALTDATGQNKATTQEFEFVTPAQPVGPVATLSLDSVEQYKLAFDTTVVDKDGGTLNLAFADTDANGGVAVAGEVLVERLVDDVWVPFKEDEIELNTVGSTYYLELLKDWTVIHGTDANEINYYTPDYNKVRVTIAKETVKSLRTDALLAKEFKEELVLELDAKSPEFTAKQALDLDGELLPAVEVEFNEPIKLPSVNNEGDSPSEQQINGEGVPQPTYEFVSSDRKTTLEGVASALTEDDKKFVITPVVPSKLTPGEWTVIIRSISDDVGNTAATLTEVVNIKAATAATGQAEIVWAAAVDNVDVVLDGDTDTADSAADNELGDVVFIQYGTEMSLDAIKSNIYQVNDKQLPEGVSITSTVVEYDSVNELTGTLVKITLPHTFLGTVTQDYVGAVSTPNMLNVNKRLTDDAGNTIKPATEVQLTYKKSGFLTTIDYAYLLANHAGLTFEDPNANAATVVSSVTVDTPPTAAYNVGDALDLSSLVVTLTKLDGSTEDVAFADFAANGLTTSIANGAVLALTDTTVTITHTASGETVNQAITVTPSAVNAGALTTAIAAGTAAGTTKATATATGANTLAVNVTVATVATPLVGADAPTGASVVSPYTSGADITATAGQFVQVYELDAAGKVVNFYEKELVAGDIQL